MNSSPVLITGAPGWLGSRLVRLLLEGTAEELGSARPTPDRPVRCLVLAGQDTSALSDLGGRVQFVPGDVRDRTGLAAFFTGADGATLFHCAGVIHPTRGVRQLYEVNDQGTRNLLDLAASAGVKRFVYVSSNSPIGVSRDPARLFDETSPYRPYMSYGKSKRLAEEAVNGAFASGRLETVIIRPPWFYGIGQPPRQSLFFTMVKNGSMPIVGTGENRRSMAYVDNICQGLLLCDQRAGAAGKTYWIADRRPYTTNEIVDTIERLLEQEFGMQVAHRRRRLPSLASEVALLIDATLQAAGLYHQKIHVLSEMNKTIACSIDKARDELGYDPKIALEEGMRRSIRWVLDQGITI